MILQVAEVRNTALSGRSGSLRLELWATSGAYSGGGRLSGYKLAQYGLASLAGGASFYAISSGSVPFTPPPTGTWNVVLVLTEYTGSSADNNGYSIVDWSNFPVPMTITGSTPTGGGGGQLDLSGRANYAPHNSNTSVILEVDTIRNLAISGTSGSIRLELWAFAAPYAGGSISGHKLAQYQLAPLAAGASRTGVSTGSIPFTKPPAGTWYVSMVLTENSGSTSNNDGYGIDDYINFPIPMVITNNIGPVVPVAGMTYTAGGSTMYYIPDLAGSLWATGLNQLGQLGDGTNTDRSTPGQVASFVSSISSGLTDTAILVKKDGTAWGMGRNTTGSIGDGSTSNRSYPVLVTANVAAAAVGGEATLFVKTDGTLWACGWNQSGSVGDGSTTMRLTPVQVALGVVAAAAGIGHSLFLKTDGSLWAMGWNAYGQLGDGTVTNRTSPVLVATGVASMAAGYGHTLYRKTDGSLWAVGLNGSGQLGDGTTTDRRVPIQVAAGVSFVAAGAYHSLFVRTDTSLWAMGSNIDGALGDGTTRSRSVPVLVSYGVTSAAAGFYHSLFRLLDGSLWGMGANLGQLGDGSNVSRVYPVPIGVYSPEPLEIRYQPIPQTAIVGRTANFSVVASGNLPLTYQWYKDGTPLDGATSAYLTVSNVQVAQSGDYSVVVSGPSGTVTSTAVALTVTLSPATITTQPVSMTQSVGQVASFSVAATGSTPISYQWYIDGELIPSATSSSYSIISVQLANRGSYTCVVTNPGGAVTSNVATLDVIQLGSRMPLASADGGLTHTLFLTQDGELWGAGDGSNSQLLGTITFAPTPMRLATGVAQASAGYGYTMYVKTDGTLWGVGSGLSGTGLYGISGTSYKTPAQVATGVRAVEAGYQHIMFAKSDGTLWGIGENSMGQLGNGTINDQTSPVHIATGGIISMAAGTDHSVFVKSNGSLWAMGSTSNSQLGDGTPPNGGFGAPVTLRVNPVEIVASGVASVAAGAHHTMWVKTDGTLWAVGNNSYGQLCDGTQILRSTPVQVASEVAAVYAAGQVTLYLKRDGTLWGMGENIFNSSSPNRYTPLQLDSDVAWAWIGEGKQRLWVKRDGTIWGAGENISYQLGDGTATRPTAPVQIAAAAPAILSKPADLSVTAGVAVNLMAVVGGTSPVTVQWYKDDEVMPAAISTLLNITPATTADSGTYKLVATNSLGSASAIVKLTVAKGAQLIAFAPLADRLLGEAPFSLAATSTSGLAPVLSILTGPATLSGNVLTLTGEGTVVLRATQPGNVDFHTAAPVDRSFNVISTRLSAALAAQSWVFNYSRPADRPDLNFIVERSHDLMIWTTDGINHTRTATGTTESWQATYPYPQSNGANLFFRLRIETR